MPYKDPEKARANARKQQRKRRERMRNPGPGRPPKGSNYIGVHTMEEAMYIQRNLLKAQGKQNIAQQEADVAAAVQSVKEQQEAINATGVLTEERQRQILSWVAENAEKPADRTAAIKALADIERKDGSTTEAEPDWVLDGRAALDAANARHVESVAGAAAGDAEVE